MQASRLIVLLALAACGREAAKQEPPPPPPPPIADETHGASLTAERRREAESLIARFECARCHDGLARAAVDPSKHCVSCHRGLNEGQYLDVPADDLARWRNRTYSLRVVPNLAAVGKRVRRAWVADFLLHPVDVRPQLVPTMPRLALDPAQAALLAEYLVPHEVLTAPPSGDRTKGAALFVARGCATCHAMTGAPPPQNPFQAEGVEPGRAVDAFQLAPDLARVRARVQPGRLLPWLLDPAAVDATTHMPTLITAEADARDLAAFLLETEPPPPPPAPVAEARLPVLARPVAFAEVAEKVFHKVCWHCHAAPFYALGDGGPGNTGGFGFAPRGLDLSTHEGLLSGSIGPDGRRRGLFGPLADGTPRLVAHLMARRLEERGGEVPGVRGMPLGLPALPLEDIQLVESWIAQDRPE